MKNKNITPPPKKKDILYKKEPSVHHEMHALAVKRFPTLIDWGRYHIEYKCFVTILSILWAHEIAGSFIDECNSLPKSNVHLGTPCIHTTLRKQIGTSNICKATTLKKLMREVTFLDAAWKRKKKTGFVLNETASSLSY